MLSFCVLIPEQRRHEHLHEEGAREPGSCLLSPHPHAVWHTKRRKPCSFIAAMMLAEPTETGPWVRARSARVDVVAWLPGAEDADHRFVAGNRLGTFPRRRRLPRRPLAACGARSSWMGS